MLARASLALFSLFGSLALAQDPATSAPERPARAPEPGHIRTDKSGLVLPAGAIDPDELVDAVARFLGRSIVWTAAEHGKTPVEPFVMQKELALDAPGCEELLSQLVWSRGFALVPLHADKGVYEILLQGGPRQRDIAANASARTPDEVLRQPSLRMYVWTQIRIEHLEANAINNLHVLFGQSQGNGSPQMVIASLGSTLLLAGMQDQIAQMLRMVKASDRPPEQPRRTELELRVAALEKSLQELRRADVPPAIDPPSTPSSTSTSGGK